MHIISSIVAAVFGIVLAILWLLVMLAVLMALVWIVAEAFSLLADVIRGRERSRAAGW